MLNYAARGRPGGSPVPAHHLTVPGLSRLSEPSNWIDFSSSAAISRSNSFDWAISAWIV